jgi:hypothetical protein
MTVWRWIPKDTHAHSEYVNLLLFHCNDSCTNTLQYYVVRTLPVLFGFRPFMMPHFKTIAWKVHVWFNEWDGTT